jgi:hypothetical protein
MRIKPSPAFVANAKCEPARTGVFIGTRACLNSGFRSRTLALGHSFVSIGKAGKAAA